MKTKKFQPTLGVLNRPFGEIDAVKIGSSFSEELVISTKADSDFQHFLTTSR